MSLKKIHEGDYIAATTDIIVVGAGHAGCEAALAAARLGCRVILFTMTLDGLANMPCNPNIGGTAKGQLVREIDALGGEMGRLADRHMIQFRMLNASKGPAVLSSRAQQDRCAYQRDMKQILEAQPGLSLIQAEITEILSEACHGTERNRIRGVRSRAGTVYEGRAVILACGTFLESKVIIGEAVYSSGPDGLAAAHGLSASLREQGIRMKRFKTGTPPRFHQRSLDFAKMTPQAGEERAQPFSFDNEANPEWRPKADLPCYLSWTSDETAALFRDNIHRSPLFSGLVEGVGPRYCPSIEDKFVKFPDHPRHHIFLEPTGLDTAEYYASGLSSSMPEDVQRAALKTVPGLENAEIMRLAYAIDYDLIDPTQLALSLEFHHLEGLYAAGQINGSSGYEEAAAQGLMAGINAARQLRGERPVILDRSQAYIAVLIDDLLTKGTDEPYRMMTSRAEYRLKLRQDNADCRLTPLAREIGLISERRWQIFREKQARIQKEMERLERERLAAGEALDAFLIRKGSSLKQGSIGLAELLRRPEIRYADLAEIDPSFPGITTDRNVAASCGALTEAEAFTVETEIKFAGYLRVEESRIHKFLQLEKKGIPASLNLEAIGGLRREAKQKLIALRPQSVGQAGRISGVSPADLSVLLVAIKEHELKQAKTPFESGGGEEQSVCDADGNTEESEKPLGGECSEAAGDDRNMRER